MSGWLGGWLVGWLVDHAGDLWPNGERRCWAQQRSYRKVSMAFQLAPSNLTFDDPEGSKINVKILWFEISRKWRQIRGWTPRQHLYVVPTGFRLVPLDLTLDNLEGSKIKVILFEIKCQEGQELRCWTQWRLYKVLMGFNLDDLERLDQDHNPLIRNFLKTVTGSRLDPRKHLLYVGPTGFRLAPSDLILDDLDGSKINDVKYVKDGKSYDVGPMDFTLDDLGWLKVKVTILWFEISWTRWQIRGWTPQEHLYIGPTGFWLAPSVHGGKDLWLWNRVLAWNGKAERQAVGKSGKQLRLNKNNTYHIVRRFHPSYFHNHYHRHRARSSGCSGETNSNLRILCNQEDIHGSLREQTGKWTVP